MQSQAKAPESSADKTDLIAPIRTLLATEKAWTKGAFARDESGSSAVSTLGPRAISFCLEGAIYRCYPEQDDDWRHDAVRNELWDRALRVGHYSLGGFNDAPGTKHSDVVSLLSEPFKGKKTPTSSGVKP